MTCWKCQSNLKGSTYMETLQPKNLSYYDSVMVKVGMLLQQFQMHSW